RRPDFLRSGTGIAVSGGAWCDCGTGLVQLGQLALVIRQSGRHPADCTACAVRRASGHHERGNAAMIAVSAMGCTAGSVGGITAIIVSATPGSAARGIAMGAAQAG